MLLLLMAVSIVSILFAIKWYIATVSISYILAMRGIEPDEHEMKSATIYVIKRLLKMQ